MENNFINANKPDSQDICFVPDGDYAGVIEKYTGKVYKPGNFVDTSGNILGQHKGIIHYTIGQRRGLGVPRGKAHIMYLESDLKLMRLYLETMMIYSQGMFMWMILTG